MRWTDTITLVAHNAPYQDSIGAWHEGDASLDVVFCNRRTLGLRRRSEATDVGMRADAEVEVRTCDYHGQTEASYSLYPGGGMETFDVEPTVSGDFTYLTLSRRLEDLTDGKGGGADGQQAG